MQERVEHIIMGEWIVKLYISHLLFKLNYKVKFKKPHK